MGSITDILKQIWKALTGAVESEAVDVETFFVSSAKYAAANIKPEVVTATADCMAAAEQAFESDSTIDKYALAFSNIVGALEKDAITFAEADVNYAIEAVIQQRNAKLAIPTPSPAPTDAQPAS